MYKEKKKPRRKLAKFSREDTLLCNFFPRYYFSFFSFQLLLFVSYFPSDETVFYSSAPRAGCWDRGAVGARQKCFLFMALHRKAVPIKLIDRRSRVCGKKSVSYHFFFFFFFLINCALTPKGRWTEVLSGGFIKFSPRIFYIFKEKGRRPGGARETRNHNNHKQNNHNHK